MNRNPDEYLVFVYGTLMKGQANHRLLRDESYLGEATLDGYDMYDLGYFPGIVPGTGTVRGELYRVVTVELLSLDVLEGQGTLYSRETVPVRLEDGSAVDAFVYVYLLCVEDCPLLKGKYSK